jgi:hypothetical protein
MWNLAGSSLRGEEKGAAEGRAPPPLLLVFGPNRAQCEQGRGWRPGRERRFLPSGRGGSPPPPLHSLAGHRPGPAQGHGRARTKKRALVLGGSRAQSETKEAGCSCRGASPSREGRQSSMSPPPLHFPRRNDDPSNTRWPALWAGRTLRAKERRSAGPSWAPPPPTAQGRPAPQVAPLLLARTSAEPARRSTPRPGRFFGEVDVCLHRPQPPTPGLAMRPACDPLRAGSSGGRQDKMAVLRSATAARFVAHRAGYGAEHSDALGEARRRCPPRPTPVRPGAEP